MYFSLHIFRSMRIHSHLKKALFGYITPVSTQYFKKIKKHIHIVQSSNVNKNETLLNLLFVFSSNKLFHTPMYLAYIGYSKTGIFFSSKILFCFCCCMGNSKVFWVVVNALLSDGLLSFSFHCMFTRNCM